MTRRELFPLLVAPLVARAQNAGPVRRIVIVRDVSPSYKNTEEITAKLVEVMRALGPGDELALIELGGPFSPEACIKVQCRMPGVAPAILAPVGTPGEWCTNKARLDAVWKRVDGSRRDVESYLRIPTSVKDPTPLFEALAYCATIMSPAGPESRTLLVFSDLVQDSNGIKSELPAKAPMEFAGVSGFALFVPWQTDFAGRAAAWRRWFIASGGVSFEMLDGAQSRTRTVLGKSAAPRTLLQRF